MNKPRLLKADEISCRIQSITDKGGAIILLYKDARVDMNILDETYGMMNWKRTHETIDGKLFCTISVWDDTKKEWVSKQDVGVESNTEATKGEASDAFKRAGFNWGIGRELYTAPFIYVQLRDDEMLRRQNAKPQASSRFKLNVETIEYNSEGVITKLVLVDRNFDVRYQFPKSTARQKSEPNNNLALLNKTEKVQMFCINSNITVSEFGAILKQLQKDGKVSNKKTKDMTDDEFSFMLNAVSNQLKAGEEEKLPWEVF